MLGNSFFRNGLGVMLCVSVFARQAFVQEPVDLGKVVVRAEPPRAWTNCFDQSVEASFAGIDGTVVQLLVQGNPIDVPLASLSVSDIDYVKTTLARFGSDLLSRRDSMPDKETAESRLSASEWKRRINHWAMDVRSFPKEPIAATAARNRIRSIRDENAIKVLESKLKTEKDINVCIAFLEALGGIAGEHAVSVLVRNAVVNNRQEVSAAASWELRNLHVPSIAIAEFAKLMKTSYGQSALMTLHVSGLLEPLQPYEAPNSEITEAIIRLLELKYEEKVPIILWRGYDTGFIPIGSGGYRSARLQTQRSFVVNQKLVPNELALELLRKYTGQDYAYSQSAWRKWLKSEAQGSANANAVYSTSKVLSSKPLMAPKTP